MSFQLDKVPFDDSNPENRCACVLLLDVSGSMFGDSINQLNEGIKLLKNELMQDKLASSRVELAVITFGSSVEVIHDFATVDQFNPLILTADGLTPMGAAINLGLDKIEERKQIYKDNGVSYYRPWMFMITDGIPTDEWLPAADRLEKEVGKKKVSFFAVGVDEADMNTLQQISPRTPIKLNNTKWQEMFQWLSASLNSTSHSQIGEQVALQPPSDWMEV